MKLRLPNKLVAAIIAVASPVLFTTLSTATVGAAAVVMVGQQALGEGSAVVPEGETVTEGSDSSRISNYQGTTVYGTANLYLQGDTGGNNGLITLGEGSNGSIYVKKGTFALNTASNATISSNLRGASLHMEDSTIFRIRKGPNASTIANPVTTTYVSGMLDLSVGGTSVANNSLTLTTDFLREEGATVAKMKKTDSGGVILSGRVELDEFNAISGYTQFKGSVKIGAFNATGGTTEFNNVGAETSATITGTLDMRSSTVNVIGGTLSAGSLNFSDSNSRLNVAENAVLNITNTQNTFKQATVNGEVHLTLNSEPTGSNSIVALNDGSNGHIYLDGGLLALNTAGNNSSSDLKKTTLHMADGTTFRIRNGLESGEVSKVGTALLTGTVKLDIANNVTTDSVLTTNFKKEEGATTAKLQRTDSGKITLGGIVSLDAIEIKNGTTVFAGSTSATTFSANDSAGTTTFSNIAAFTTINAANKNITLGTRGEGETATHGTLTVNGAASIGTLNLGAGTSATFSSGEHTINTINADEYNDAAASIRLTDNATVTVSNTIQIGAQGGSYVVEQGSTLKLTSYGFRIEAVEGADAAIISSTQYSSSGGHYTYDKGRADFTINNAKITAAYAAAATIGNKLENSIIINNAAGTLTVSHDASTLKGVHAKLGDVVVAQTNSSVDTLKSIKAEGGDVTLQNLTAQTGLSLNELVIGNSKTVSALTDGSAAVNAQESNVAAISILEGGKLTAHSGATLNANLTMQSGSTLEVQKGGLSLGCSLTLNNGENFVLHGATVTDGKLENYILYTGVDSFVLNGTAITEMGWYDAKDIAADRNIINSITADGTALDLEQHSYVFGFWNGTVSLAESTVPEPTTATLSLLALAGLAARRRRK